MVKSHGRTEPASKPLEGVLKFHSGIGKVPHFPGKSTETTEFQRFRTTFLNSKKVEYEEYGEISSRTQMQSSQRGGSRAAPLSPSPRRRRRQTERRQSYLNFIRSRRSLRRRRNKQRSRHHIMQNRRRRAAAVQSRGIRGKEEKRRVESGCYRRRRRNCGLLRPLAERG